MQFPGTKGTGLHDRAGAGLNFFLLPGQQFNRKSDALSGSFRTCPFPARRQLQGRWGLPAELFRVLPWPRSVRGGVLQAGRLVHRPGLHSVNTLTGERGRVRAARALLRGHPISEASPRFAGPSSSWHAGGEACEINPVVREWAGLSHPLAATIPENTAPTGRAVAGVPPLTW